MCDGIQNFVVSYNADVQMSLDDFGALSWGMR